MEDNRQPSPGSSGESSPWTAAFRTGEMKLALAIVAVFAIAGLLDQQHNYFHWDTFFGSCDQIVHQTAFLGIFALGAATVIIAGGIDLSVGSMIAFSATICASIMVLLAPAAMDSGRGSDETLSLGVMAVAIAGAVLSGFLVGSLHAWLISSIGLPPFIATLATLVGLRSMARVICGQVTGLMLGGESTQIRVGDARFRSLATNHWIPIIVCLALLAALSTFLRRTVAGRHIYALGGNEQAARLSGIRTENVKWLAYVISSVTASIAGVLYLAEISEADPQTLAAGYELNAIAAAVVGGCSLQGGVGTALGTLLGGMFMWTVIDGISMIIKKNADTYQGWIVGIVVVLAVAFNQLRQSAGLTRQFFSGALGYVAIVVLSLLAGLCGAVLQGRSAGAAAVVITLAVLFGVKFFGDRSTKRG